MPKAIRHLARPDEPSEKDNCSRIGARTHNQSTLSCEKAVKREIQNYSFFVLDNPHSAIILIPHFATVPAPLATAQPVMSPGRDALAGVCPCAFAPPLCTPLLRAAPASP